MSRDRHYYYVGSANGFGPERYETLADAAEAIRRAQGWTEIHLLDEGPTTEAAVPTHTAYATAEERDASNDWSAPHIYEIYVSHLS